MSSSSAESLSGDTAASHNPISKREKLNEQDVDGQLALEEECSPCRPSPHSELPAQQIVISFDIGDPDNPHNWSRKRKAYVVIVGIASVLNSTVGSSIAAGATDSLSEYFHNHNQAQLVLPTSIYLVGYVLGPLAFGPLSESYGRKPVMMGTFLLYSAFTLGCALAPSFGALIVFRLLVGMGASAPISVVGGQYADVYANPTARGRAMTAFMTATMFGPLLGPISSGFLSPISWRWIFWLCLILAGATWPLIIFSPETYGPIILKQRAQRLRKENGNDNNNSNIVAPIELEKKGTKELLTVVLTRPLRMLCFEAIVLCSCLYLAFAYAIFYMFFQAFPIIFRDIYGFNAGEEGLAFLPIGIGSSIACGIYLWWDYILQNAKDRKPPAAWTQIEEYRRLPLACVGGPFFVISLFWMGWSARPDVHWIVPVLSSLPFGVGFLLLFQGLLNYLVDAYEIFAASATAAAATSRSLFGAILPFAAKPMYNRLGVPWACSLLGFLSLAMCVIPFAFIKYGDGIRARSEFCQYLKQKKMEEEASMEARIEKERQNSHTSNVESPEKMA